MARDVHFNYTADDETGSAAASVERRMKETGKKVGKGLGDDTSKGLIGGLKNAVPTGGQLIATIGVAAAPLLGATLGAAVIAGVSGAAIGAGVLIAAKDPRVKEAGGALADHLMAGLQQDASSFVEPLLRQVDKVGTRFDLLRPRIKRIFDNSAGFLDPLVDGALNGLDGILRGVDATVAKAGPVISALSYTFDTLGNSAGDALETIAGGSDGAAAGLETMADIGGAAIEGVGWAVRGLSEVFGLAEKRGLELHAQLVQLGIASDTTGQFVAHTATSTGELSENTELLAMKAAGALAPIDVLSDRINGLSDASRSAFAAETSVGEAMEATTAAAKKNGKTLDANTEKGRANRTSLQNLANSLIAQYNATVAVNGAGAQSEAVADQNRAAFIRLATAMTGSKSKAAQLATQLGLIPSKKTVNVTLIDQASAKAKTIQSSINSIKGKTVTVRVVSTGGAKGQVLYGNQAPQFDARDSYGRAAASTGTYRTGGPSPVSVSNEVNVSLDGAPFYAMTSRVVDRSASRSAFRQKVGRR